MAVPPLSLSKPHVDQTLGLPEPVIANAPGAEEIERRVNEILMQWLMRYFHGAVPFSTPNAADRTFVDCETLYDEATPSLPQSKPIIHTVIADKREDNGVRIAGGFWEYTGTWRFSTDILTNKQMSASDTTSLNRKDAANLTGDSLCRKVADQLAWLLRSPHIQSLAEKGVCRVKLTAPPRLIPAGAYHARLLNFSAEITFRIPRNDP